MFKPALLALAIGKHVTLKILHICVVVIRCQHPPFKLGGILKNVPYLFANDLSLVLSDDLVSSQAKESFQSPIHPDYPEVFVEDEDSTYRGVDNIVGQRTVACLRLDQRLLYLPALGVVSATAWTSIRSPSSS